MRIRHLGSTRIVGIIALLTAIAVYCLPAGSAYAASSVPARPASCHAAMNTWTLENVTIGVAASNIWCSWPNSQAQPRMQACSGGAYTIQEDVWQTQQPFPGGQRYAETGRSNWATYPPDCQWHYGPMSNLWGGLSDPEWGCAWAQLYDLQSKDYMCTYVSQ